MAKNSFHECGLIVSAQSFRQFPEDSGAEVAFAGYSNTGKSSVINTITGRHGLARTSKAPGRTRQLNFFSLGPGRRLVDLPGYGYARISAEMKQQWEETMTRYLESRHSLLALVVVMDVRRPMKELDHVLLGWCREACLPAHIILNKSDKLTRSAGRKVLQQVMDQAGADTTVQLFSARLKTGVDESRKRLDQWFAGSAHKF